MNDATERTIVSRTSRLRLSPPAAAQPPTVWIFDQCAELGAMRLVCRLLQASNCAVKGGSTFCWRQLGIVPWHVRSTKMYLAFLF